MKSFVAIFVIFAVSFAFGDKTKDEVFDEYLKKNNLRFGRGANVEKAKDNVFRRWKEVEDHNKEFKEGKTFFEMALNDLSWQDREQIAREKLGFILPPTVNNSDLPPLRTKRSTLPAYFNWNDKVRNYLVN